MKISCIGLIGDCRTVFQGNIGVVLAREDHFCARKVLVNQVAKPQRHIEAKVFFEQTVRPGRTRVLPDMTRVDHDSADLQA